MDLRYRSPMRIIAGTHGGRRIQAPPGRATRPMLDRVREALFSTLGERVEDARVLDLFAGTGSLGLECLSRGARETILIERDRATAKLLRANVASLGLEDRCQVVVGDALEPFLWGLRADKAAPGYDLIFLDPPYPMVKEARTRRTFLERLALLVSHHLRTDGMLVLHTPRRTLDEGDFPDGVSARLREYGSNALWYVTREEGS